MQGGVAFDASTVRWEHALHGLWGVGVRKPRPFADFEARFRALSADPKGILRLRGYGMDGHDGYRVSLTKPLGSKIDRGYRWTLGAGIDQRHRARQIAGELRRRTAQRSAAIAARDRPAEGIVEAVRQHADADAAAELEAALRAAGVESLSRAVEVHDERVTCEQQITELGKQVKATSSKSLAQLREDLAMCVAELERLGPAGATALEAVTLVTSERTAAVAALAEFRENMIELRTQHREHRRVTRCELTVQRPPDALELRVDHASMRELEQQQVRLTRGGNHGANRGADLRRGYLHNALWAHSLL